MPAAGIFDLLPQLGHDTPLLELGDQFSSRLSLTYPDPPDPEPLPEFPDVASELSVLPFVELTKNHKED